MLNSLYCSMLTGMPNTFKGSTFVVAFVALLNYLISFDNNMHHLLLIGNIYII